jgi:polyhydroxyalkanoate synthesis regulator phasin
MGSEDPNGAREADDGGVAEALRAAIERTLAATAPAAAETRERAGDLVDEISKRGQGARDELARRSQDAGAEIARLGQEAREALSKRGLEATSELRSQLDSFEKRLSSVEELLRRAQPDGTAGDSDTAPKPKAKAED